MNTHVKKHFLDWLENRATPKSEIDHHLQECDECRLYYQKMAQLLDPEVVSGFPKLLADPFLPTQIIARLASDRRNESDRYGLVIRLVLNGAAVVMALVVGVLIGKSLSVHSPGQPAAETITTLYQQAVVPDDLDTQMDALYQRLGGKPQ